MAAVTGEDISIIPKDIIREETAIVMMTAAIIMIEEIMIEEITTGGVMKDAGKEEILVSSGKAGDRGTAV
jgi:hypothetical protein